MSDDEKPIAKFLRLMNGDDVIAETVETEDDDGILYTLYHPLKVIYTPVDTTGYLSVAFMPWVFPRICDQQDFVIHAEDVLMVVDVSEKMNIYYWESVDTYTGKSEKPYEPVEETYEEMPEEDETALLEALKELGLKRTFH